MPESANEVVLVTGASSGLGADFARVFAAGGARVILVARRRAALEQLAAEIARTGRGAAEVVPCDLEAPRAAEDLVAEVERRGLAVDVLVNNAGFGTRGAFAGLDPGRERALLAVNVQAVVSLTRLLLPGMLARRRGGVINVASTAAFQPGPFMASYYASKAFVLSFSEALSEEVRGGGVVVTCLCPGPTATEFGATSTMDESAIFRMGTMGAPAVVRAGVDGFRAGRAIVVPGLRNRLGTWSVRFTPRAVVRRLVASLQR